MRALHPVQQVSVSLVYLQIKQKKVDIKVLGVKVYSFL